MEKNTAGQKWVVFAFNRTTNAPVTGDAANITANLRIDGGAANAVDDTNPTELEDGYYVFDISQAETNGDLLLLCPASSTADVQVIGVPGAVFTVPPNFNTLGIETDGDLTQVNTCVANSDMRGTDGANTVTPNTVTPPTKAEMDAAFSEIKGATWDSSTDTLEAIRDRGDSSWVTATTVSVSGTVTTDSASREASKADVSGLPTAAEIKTAMEADGSKLDHLWEMTEDDGGVRRLTSNALEQAPTGGGGTVSIVTETINVESE
jgi:hypothetical protein